jgi:hypothetical protein
VPPSRIFGCGANAATRGDPTAPAWRVGQSDRKWAGSNSGGRRAGAAVTSSPRLTSHPGTAREPPLTAWKRCTRDPFLERIARAQPPAPSHLLRGGTGGVSDGRSARRFTFAIITASKKVRHVVRFRILFRFPLSLSLATGTGKGGYPERDPSPRRNRAPSPPLLIRGSKAGPPKGSTAASDRVGPTLTTGQGFEGWPSEGFNSRLRSRGPDTHYWSGVRRPAPRRVPWPPHATRAPRPLLIRGSKAGPRRVHSRLRHRGVRSIHNRGSGYAPEVP